MANPIQSKPGITGASVLAIPKDWDQSWFKHLVHNQLKGADIRNAVGTGGIKVSGTLASPYATIGFAPPITLPGQVTITAPSTAIPALVVNGFNNANVGAIVVNGSAPGGNLIQLFNTSNGTGLKGWAIRVGSTGAFAVMTTSDTGTQLNDGFIMGRDSSGNVSAAIINQQVGGAVALTINSSNLAVNSQYDFKINRTASTANTIVGGPCMGLFDTGATTVTLLQQAGGQSELWQYNSGWTEIFAVNTLNRMMLAEQTAMYNNFVAGAGNSSKLTISRYTSGTASTTVAGAYYLNIGGGEYNGSPSYRLIGFGYNLASLASCPAFIGYNETNDAGDTLGDIIIGTRSVTTDTQPTIAFRVTSAGRTVIADTSFNYYTAGYLEVPQTPVSGNYTCVLSDSGKSIVSVTASALTITIPANASVPYPVGTVITFSTINGAGTVSITCGDTMYLAGTGTTGTRTLANNGIATAIKVGSTQWNISGAGLT